MSLNEPCEKSGNMILLKPVVFSKWESNAFTETERQYPIDFGQAILQTHHITILLSGKKLISMPENQEIVLPDDLGVFVFKAEHNNNFIQITTVASINKSRIDAKYYSELKDFFDQVIKKWDEPFIFE